MAATVESRNLRHLDPATVDVAAYEADPGTFVVRTRARSSTASGRGERTPPGWPRGRG